MTCARRRPPVSDESGQILVITGFLMILLIAVVGLVVDFGHAFLVQRQLQAGVDAGALAGAQHLPIADEATQVAQEYGPSPGRKNAVHTVSNATTTVRARCLRGVPGCSRRYGTVNALLVQATSDVPTWFGRVVGVKKIKVSAQATACSPCAVKPLDIMIVLDRTGSMCRTGSGPYERPTCPDLRFAKEGVRTFLGLLDPSIDKVGLALTPPVRDESWISSCPTPNGYLPWNTTPNPNVPSGDPRRNISGAYYAFDAYWPYWDLPPGPNPPTPSRYVVAPLEGADGVPADDYVIQDADGEWQLNPASNLVQRLDCAGAEGSTSYALALEEAQYQLNRNGRGGVQDVIIFLGDGAVNTSPMNLPIHWSNTSFWQRRPCGAAVESAARIKQGGTIVYTIGYDLNGEGTDYERCLRPDQFGHQQASTPANYEAVQAWGSTAYDAIRAMATSPEHFYNKPDPGQVNTIFTQIAIDLSGSKARLIDDAHPNLTG